MRTGGLGSRVHDLNYTRIGINLPVMYNAGVRLVHCTHGASLLIRTKEVLGRLLARHEGRQNKEFHNQLAE